MDYEKLGVFYLGREDMSGSERTPLLYDSKDLTTHGVCVGMTGSGKTGLCLSLIEEAAMDGIPVLAIDPKGDLGNLLLTFPELAPSDFEPWIDPGEAMRTGQTPEAYAQTVAERWKEGLADWGQSGDRIAELRKRAEFEIFTPGSTAGKPLTVLRSFQAPPESTRQDTEALGVRINAAVSSLLALMGIDADPLQSREHLLLAKILEHAWTQGQSLTLPDVLRALQRPPFEQVGFFDLETFFPAGDRMKLALRLNNLLASPGFKVWLEGDPLDIPKLMYAPDGRPKVSILSIAHLDDSERMFFVTALLNELLAWMRSQPGTSSLRALLYMDEIFGYFPPSANPPSKQPMLTLLKQGRAFGVGCMLATQNPVDLDYKGLSNTGTWFLGRLQTERDKLRVLDGLEGVSGDRPFDRGEMDKVLSGLGKRKFLLHNVHEDHPVVFQTRWAMSYLRGPLTRDQIARLSGDDAEESAPVAGSEVPPPPPVPAAPMLDVTAPSARSDSAPMLPRSIQQVYLEPEVPHDKVVYRPKVLAVARLHFVSSKAGIDQWENRYMLLDLPDNLPILDWDAATVLESEPKLVSDAPSKGTYADLPSSAGVSKNYTAWKREGKHWLYQHAEMEWYRCPKMKLVSQPGESEGAFRGRVQLAIREERDRALEKVRTRYETKFATTRDRIRRAEDRIEREEAQYSQKKMDTVIGFGSTVLSALMGRKKMSVGNVSRASTSMRRAGKLGKEKDDIARAQDELASQQQRMTDLDAQFQSEITALQEKWNPEAVEVAVESLAPRKSDLRFVVFALAWT